MNRERQSHLVTELESVGCGVGGEALHFLSFSKQNVKELFVVKIHLKEITLVHAPTGPSVRSNKHSETLGPHGTFSGSRETFNGQTVSLMGHFEHESLGSSELCLRAMPTPPSLTLVSLE